MYFHKPQEKPRRWGSFQDVQYAIRKNAEKIYQIDSDSIVLCMPLFWGLSPLDYSGYNNHGTNYGTTYKDGSLSFDGGNDYVLLGDVNKFEFTSSFTVSAWIYLLDQSSIATITGKGGGFPKGWQFNIAANERIGLVIGSVQTYSGIQSINNWYHAVGVYNGTHALIYLNGDFIISNAATLTAHLTESVAIGARAGTSQYFNGLIDEVRVSNVACTADQIALFYDLPYGLYQPVARPVYFLPSIEVIMNQFQKSNLGADLFNGALL